MSGLDRARLAAQEVRRARRVATEDADVEQFERDRDRPDEAPRARFMADDEPWDVGALHEMQYGPGARNW